LRVKLVDESAAAVVRNIVLGMFGTVTGSWFFNHVGIAGLTAFTLDSLLVGVAGTGVVRIFYHAFRRSLR